MDEQLTNLIDAAYQSFTERGAADEAVLAAQQAVADAQDRATQETNAAAEARSAADQRYAELLAYLAERLGQPAPGPVGPAAAGAAAQARSVSRR